MEDVDTTDTVEATVEAVTASGADGGLSNAALLAMLTVGANPVIDGSSTTGTINWSFDSGSEAFNHLADGETLVLEYTLQADDGCRPDGINATSDFPRWHDAGADDPLFAKPQAWRGRANLRAFIHFLRIIPNHLAATIAPFIAALPQDTFPFLRQVAKIRCKLTWQFW